MDLEMPGYWPDNRKPERSTDPAEKPYTAKGKLYDGDEEVTLLLLLQRVRAIEGQIEKMRGRGMKSPAREFLETVGVLDSDAFQSDLRELLEALDMPSGAQPRSPHEVFQGALVVVKRMRYALETIALLDEADGHEVTVEDAFRAIGIATGTLGKHPSEIVAARTQRE